MQFGGTDAKGQFNFPAGLALEGGANAYVADLSNHRIRRFDRFGADLSKWGSSGSGNGQFWYPNGVAVNASGNVYPAEWGAGSGLGPRGVAVDSSGNVHPADLSNNRVQKFNKAGGFITQWARLGAETGEADTPYGVAADEVGNVYLLDTLNSRVQVFDSAGNVKGQWGSFGTGNGQFSFPGGIATNAAGTIVYVADSENHRIQAFDGFGLTKVTLRYSAGANGTISGNAAQTPYSGGSGTPVTALANPDYHFVSWSDGVTTAARTDRAVPASCSVTANFARTEVNHALRFQAGAGGTLRGPIRQTVRAGGDASAVSAVSGTGHHFVKWAGDRSFDTTAANPLTVKNVKASQNIIAHFSANQYQVTFVAGAHGDLTGKTLQSVSYGGSTTSVSAVPRQGFHFVNWTDADNRVVSYSDTLKFTNVTTTKRLTANFK